MRESSIGPTPRSWPLTLSPASIFQSNKRSVAPKQQKEEIFDLIGESITCSEGSDDGMFLRAIVQLAARFRVLEVMKVLRTAAFSCQRRQWWCHPLCHRSQASPQHCHPPYHWSQASHCLYHPSPVSFRRCFCRCQPSQVSHRRFHRLCHPSQASLQVFWIMSHRIVC